MTNQEKDVFLRTEIISANVIYKDEKYLLVQEKKPSAYRLWNLPAGRVEEGYSLEETAIKEAKEETGFDVRIVRKLGIFQKTTKEVVKHVFESEIIGGEITIAEDEILDVQWFSIDEIRNMKDTLRNPWVLESIELFNTRHSVTMKTAIIIHGYNDKSEYLDISRPAASNDHWLPWLQRQLLLKGVLAQTPEMPGFYEPHYEEWKKMLERFDLNENTILVGHSCGGGFLIRWLSENNVKVGKVVLVAPWLNPNNLIEESFDKSFFKFDIDENIASKTGGLIVMYSADDHSEILETIKILKPKLKNAEFQEFQGKGHFCFRDLKTEAFPELLANLT